MSDETREAGEGRFNGSFNHEVFSEHARERDLAGEGRPGHPDVGVNESVRFEGRVLRLDLRINEHVFDLKTNNLEQRSAAETAALGRAHGRQAAEYVVGSGLGDLGKGHVLHTGKAGSEAAMTAYSEGVRAGGKELGIDVAYERIASGDPRDAADRAYQIASRSGR